MMLMPPRPPTARRPNGQCRNPLRIMLLVGLASLGPLSSASASTDSPGPRSEDFAVAMENYEDNRWPAAFEQFARLADQGHRDAARMAWQMWRYGPELFTRRFEVAPEQRAHWQAVWRQAPGALLPATAALGSTSAGQ